MIRLDQPWQGDTGLRPLQDARPTPMPPTQPGLGSGPAPDPRCLAPDYRGSGKLRGLGTLVTGADGGIGRAVAVLYAREGADVAMAYTTSDNEAEATRRFVEAEGARCLVLKGDATDDAWCRRAVQRTVAAFGRLDVLVNNAQFQDHAERLDDLGDRRWQLTLDANIAGYFRMARAALLYLPRGGSIINTGAITALEGSAHLGEYSATQGAIHTFTKSLAGSLLERGIRVNAVAPGPAWTWFPAAEKPAGSGAAPDPVMGQAMGQATDPPAGRRAGTLRAVQPEELSPAYVFLASPVCAGYLTGLVLSVAGGVGGA